MTIASQDDDTQPPVTRDLLLDLLFPASATVEQRLAEIEEDRDLLLRQLEISREYEKRRRERGQTGS